MKTTRFFGNNAKALLLMVVAATMATTRVNAQISNETQGVGGLVLDSLYTTGSNGARSMKYVYEYTLAKKPKVRWELAYFDDTNHSLDEPRTSGYDAYTYDDQDRQQKQETYTESGGAFHLTHIEEIAEYDTETGLPAVIYTYDVDEQDPDATVPDGSPTVKKSGMSEVSAHWRKSFSLNSRFTIQPMFYGRLLFGSIVPAVFGNTIGGEWFGHYVEQQMPFAGIGNMECGPLFRVCTASGTAAYWRQQLCIASPGRSPTGHKTKELLDRSTMLGVQAAYYYNTIFGPLGATFGYSSHTKEPYLYVNLGYEF